MPEEQRAIFCRRWLDAELGEAPSPTQVTCWLDIKASYVAMRATPGPLSEMLPARVCRYMEIHKICVQSVAASIATGYRSNRRGWESGGKRGRLLGDRIFATISDDVTANGA